MGLLLRQRDLVALFIHADEGDVAGIDARFRGYVSFCWRDLNGVGDGCFPLLCAGDIKTEDGGRRRRLPGGIPPVRRCAMRTALDG